MATTTRQTKPRPKPKRTAPSAPPAPAAPSAPARAPEAVADPAIHQSLVVFAKSLARLSAFYQRTLGVQVVETSTSHHLLRGPGTEVVVHAIPRQYAVGITITKPPVPREDTPFKPAFVVADLAAVRAAAKATGGHLKPVEQAWHFRGATVLDGWDPEGNIVQFKQLDAPAP